MVRKTKEDAEITRQRIIDAAREVFLTKGVSRTSLAQVASHAGVTRGAVYWHFKNKSDLFHAMREQVFLPLIDRMDDTLSTVKSNGKPNNDPLTKLESFLKDTFKVLNENQATRETYEIMMTKCEYVDELAPVLKQILENCGDIIGKIENSYKEAQEQALLNTGQEPADLAMDTHLFFSGLLHMWVKDHESTKFRNQADSLISNHINLRRK